MELELGWLGGVELFISRQRLIRWDGVELVFDIHAAAGNCTANPIQSNPIARCCYPSRAYSTVAGAAGRRGEEGYDRQP